MKEANMKNGLMAFGSVSFVLISWMRNWLELNNHMDRFFPRHIKYMTVNDPKHFNK